MAEKNLLRAIRQSCNKLDKISQLVKEVISGSHKTYRYILVTGLLAKATNNDINPLALQAGAPLKGAYDARSLCHKVLVPFERDFLHNSLGGSNEPFLNKPARFTHLSKENAVRGGNDRETLNKVIEIFESIKSSDEAKSYLACSLKFAIKRADSLSKVNQLTTTSNPTIMDIYEFIIHFIAKSFQGETCAITVGAVEKMYSSELKGSYRVIPHKINQSGSSSREIGDIDVFKKSKFQYAVEVKDKNFTVQDVEHAFNKMIKGGASKGIFVYGPRASYDEEKVREGLNKFRGKKFFPVFIDIYTYSRMMLFRCSPSKKESFARAVMETVSESNPREDVRKWIKEVIKELNWK